MGGATPEGNVVQVDLCHPRSAAGFLNAKFGIAPDIDPVNGTRFTDPGALGSISGLFAIIGIAGTELGSDFGCVFVWPRPGLPDIGMGTDEMTGRSDTVTKFNLPGINIE